MKIQPQPSDMCTKSLLSSWTIFETSCPKILNYYACEYPIIPELFFQKWLPIEFGSNHSYDTRTPSYFCQIPCCKTSFGQRFFRSRVANWWNDLPSSLFNVSRRSDFSWSVYNYLFN